mmetsp:Transcript_23949/g.51645  ORF Transcript_23949/g.51645 Transcript_23949/m.51645 type:complete len:345 (+) Transcript_23949:1285-2319(+)
MFITTEAKHFFDRIHDLAEQLPPSPMLVPATTAMLAAFCMAIAARRSWQRTKPLNFHSSAEGGGSQVALNLPLRRCCFSACACWARAARSCLGGIACLYRAITCTMCRSGRVHQKRPSAQTASRSQSLGSHEPNVALSSASNIVSWPDAGKVALLADDEALDNAKHALRELLAQLPTDPESLHNLSTPTTRGVWRQAMPLVELERQSRIFPTVRGNETPYFEHLEPPRQHQGFTARERIRSLRPMKVPGRASLHQMQRESMISSRVGRNNMSCQPPARGAATQRRTPDHLQLDRARHVPPLGHHRVARTLVPNEQADSYAPWMYSTPRQRFQRGAWLTHQTQLM